MTLTALREAGDLGEIHTAAAVIQRWPGESFYYFTNDEGCLVVSAIVHHGGIPVRINLDALCGGQGWGVWAIPDEGTEVLLGSDDGDFEGELYVIHRNHKAPTGLAPSRLYVLAPTVEIRTANGTVAEIDGALTGRAIDPFTGQTHFALGNASAKTLIEK